MEAVTVRRARWVIEYAGKDISADIYPYVLGVTYTDALEGEADDLDITIEDRDHRWKNGWWPQKGDKIRLSIGYDGEALANCGQFQVDEVELSGPPDTVNLRGLSAGVTESMRTSATVAYEQKTIGEIAADIAKKHGLSLVGTISAEKRNRRHRRVTQRKEGDLEFLKRIGEQEGIIFTIKDAQLVWHDRDKLDSAAAIDTIRRTDCTRFSFRSKTDQTFKSCTISYFDPKEKKLIEHTEEAADVKTGDTLRLYDRCESKADAIVKAKAALRNRNGSQVEGSVTIPGRPHMAAGGNVAVEGFVVLDGIYRVIKARHTMDRREGYTTEIDLHTTTANAKKLEK